MSEEAEDQPPPKRPRSATPSPPADQVHDNVLETVLQFLDAPRDRSAASLVCRSWHRAESATRGAVSVRNLFAASAVHTDADLDLLVRSLPQRRTDAVDVGRPGFIVFGESPQPASGGYILSGSIPLQSIPQTKQQLIWV